MEKDIIDGRYEGEGVIGTRVKKDWKGVKLDIVTSSCSWLDFTAWCKDRGANV